MTSKRQRCNCSPTTSEAMTTLTPCARLLSLTLPLHCTPLGCYNGYDTRRYTRRCWWWWRDGSVCVVRVVRRWMRWRSVPVARPVSHRPPAMLGGLPSHQPSSSHHAAPLPAGETARRLGRAPLLSAGFRISQQPRRLQACACGDTMLGGWRHAVAREENPKTDATEDGHCWVFCRGASVS
jgi:hypothetical protein